MDSPPPSPGFDGLEGLHDGADGLQKEAFAWTPTKVSLAVFIFLLSGVLEVGGGWLVWQALREGKPWWWALMGCLVLCAYGFAPCAQPSGEFGRIYAVYGGFFIVLSYLWGWALDGTRPDKGDVVGGSIALVGVSIAMFWAR
mmetsp:Transcript_46137/g.147628  ORF Transcript_46137/g.147628 Transcript_46137/m.147628 type:complete len:142 (-) Transcript_46137:906-1331(-)|eukprot:CAMPEP_0182891686 /NCGR_PEP_ID=MMETSP0034_2-20130328/23412_1 /TAXON_ID=156128 /ORGANISM="Nephroselmis pyriformis, Strain CCMP717" /LENGTH=141 /DNA_ID=CAMNT_0025025309 /DNA_START=52 /DNA_END=477 /DNA_ORIENTATION=-